MQPTEYVGTIFDNESNPHKVTVAFTLALKALENGHSASLILMIDAVELACPGRFDTFNIGEPFEAVKDLQEAFLQKGGNILVCQSCMVHKKIGQDDIDPRFSVINGNEVVTYIMQAKGALQIS